MKPRRNSPAPTTNQRDVRIARAVETWFENNQSDLPWRSTYEPYLVWVSEIMLQQTRMDVVVGGGYFARFIERFPDVRSLAEAAEEDVVAAWSGLGYYQRARMLHRAAGTTLREYGGQIPADPEKIRALEGVGRYTAGAISSIAFDLPEPIVDGNVIRLLSRLDDLDDPVGSAALSIALWSRAANLVTLARSPRALNQGLMELGAGVCTPANPRCDVCPLGRDCVALARDTVGERPARKAKRAPNRLHVRLLLIENDRGEVLMVRPGGSLMRGMLHLPQDRADLIADAALGEGTFDLGESLGTFNHTITHRRISFEVCRATMVDGRIAERPGSWEWIAIGRLGEQPHPSYVRKALELNGRTFQVLP